METVLETRGELITVESPEKLRELLGINGEENSILTQETLAEPESDQRSEEDRLIKRLTEYVLRNGSLTEYEERVLKRLFPIRVRLLELEDDTIPANTQKDFGTSQEMVIYRVGTLTMEPGSSMVIRNTQLIMDIQKLVRKRNSKEAVYDLSILGVDGKKGAAQTETGKQGGVGAQGALGTCSSPGIQGDDGGPGQQGEPGADGQQGNRGENGKKSMGAEITIRSFSEDTTEFVVYTCSGAGGDGGEGGKGGKGGTGGAGGDGATCGCEGTSGGHGGPGGKGGKGGKGGTGGDGADGDDITIKVPVGCKGMIKTASKEAEGGKGGAGGKGGDGGDGGKGGTGGKHHGDGSTGGSGSGGEAGEIGDDSKVKGMPGHISIVEMNF